MVDVKQSTTYCFNFPTYQKTQLIETMKRLENMVYIHDIVVGRSEKATPNELLTFVSSINYDKL